MPKNSKDNSLKRFKQLALISNRYFDYSSRPFFDTLRRRYTRNIKNTLKLLNKEEKIIIYKEFFDPNKKIYWWVNRYSRSTYYRKRFTAIKSFMENYSL